MINIYMCGCVRIELFIKECVSLFRAHCSNTLKCNGVRTCARIYVYTFVINLHLTEY